MNIIFKEPSYYRVKLSDISLTREKIENKEFEQCTFTKMYLTDCAFLKCKFIECTFENCILSALKPINSTFSDLSIKDSKIIGCDWTVASRLETLAFSDSQINYSSFRFLKLQKTKLINSIAKEADFTETDLSESDFSGTDFEGTIFFRTNLTKVNFKKAKNYYIDTKTNTLKKAQFSFPEAINLLKSLDISVEY